MKYNISLFSLVFVFQLQYAQISDFETINFKLADSIALKYKNEPLSNLPKLSHDLTVNLNSEAEKFRALFKWICVNLSNDYGLYHRNMRKRYRFKNDSLKLSEWNDTFKRIIFKKMVKDKRTICTGYAYLLKELSNLIGLECEIVHGYGKTSTTLIYEDTAPNHSWNVVKLNGKWYLADPTWASGIPDPETNKFKFYFNDGYFLGYPELFAVNHFPLEEQWLLLSHKAPDFETFLKNPIIYGGAYTYLKSIEKPTGMHLDIKKHDQLIFNYKLKIVIDTKSVMLRINNGFKDITIAPDYIKLEDGVLILKHRFDHKGFYDVHLLIDEMLISTHTVKVTS